MKTLLTIVITVVATTVAFMWIARYKTSWLMKLEFDPQGFPYVKKEDDKFVLNGTTYVYQNGVWIELDSNGFPVKPKLGDKYTYGGITYSYNGLNWVPIQTK